MSSMSKTEYYSRMLGHVWMDVMPYAVSYPKETLMAATRNLRKNINKNTESLRKEIRNLRKKTQINRGRDKYCNKCSSN